MAEEMKDARRAVAGMGGVLMLSLVLALGALMPLGAACWGLEVGLVAMEPFGVIGASFIVPFVCAPPFGRLSVALIFGYQEECVDGEPKAIRIESGRLRSSFPQSRLSEGCADESKASLDCNSKGGIEKE